MKTFKGFMREGSGFPTSCTEPCRSGGSGDKSSFISVIQQVVKRLSAFVGQIGNQEYLLPEHAVNRLRGSLERIGFTFGEVPTMEGKSGSFDLPMSNLVDVLEKTGILRLMNF